MKNNFVHQWTNKIFIKKIQYLLNNKISNINLDKKINKNIKMIYKLGSLSDIENKDFIKNIYNKKNIKISSKILPSLFIKFYKNQKISKFNKILSLKFFTTELNKIKNRNKTINLLDFQLKNKELKNLIKEKQILKKDKSMDYNKCLIKTVKIDKKINLKELIISNNKGIENECNNTTYSFYNSPLPSIRSRYFLTHNVNDNNNDYENKIIIF